MSSLSTRQGDSQGGMKPNKLTMLNYCITGLRKGKTFETKINPVIVSHVPLSN